MSRRGNAYPFQAEVTGLKAFFRRKGWREVLIFTCFLLLSLALWCLQALQDDYEIEIVLPIKYDYLPPNMEASADSPKEVVAKVRDKGMVLLKYLWTRSFSPLEIDVRTLPREANTSELTVTRRILEAGIMKRLNSSTYLLSFEPSSIRMTYNKLDNREIVVEADLTLETEAGFQLSDRVIITPAKVRVYADRAKLDSIQAVRTAPIRLTGLSRTKTLTVRLAKINGVRFEPQSVKVTVPVEEFTERRLTLSIHCDSVPAGYALRMFPNTAEAVCNVPLSHFKELSEDRLDILIPFREFEAHREEGKITLRLTKKPDWLTDYDLNPDAIEFILEEQ
jgi:hypothetical protein